MKKILFAVVAVIMTMSVMAQCPQQKASCSAQHAGQCQVKKECTKHECVYSPETRAMMQVDRLSRVIKDLTGAEREQLLAFYKSHYIKCEKRKETANPMTKEECRKECDAELRKVLGDDRYIQYLEVMRVERSGCAMRPAPHGPRCEKPCFNGKKTTSCQKTCASTCTKK